MTVEFGEGIDIGIYTTNFENEFISLTDIAKYRNEDDPRLGADIKNNYVIMQMVVIKYQEDIILPYKVFALMDEVIESGLSYELRLRGIYGCCPI